MHKGEQSGLPGTPQDLEHLAIVELQPSFVSHEDLHGGDTPLGKARDLIEDVGPRVGDGHVKPVVDDGFPVRTCLPLVERVAERSPFRLNREVDVCRRAAECRGHGSGVEVIA